MITPQEQYPELATSLGFKGLYFKREDLHPYGSHKGRSIPYMIDHYYKNGSRYFAISSSGNAGLASILKAKEMSDIKLDVFVGLNIAPNKLEKLYKTIDVPGVGDRISIIKTERPLQSSAKAVTSGAVSLRQSTDDIALLGYESLAEELASIKGLNVVFIGASSGTTAQALAKYFIDHNLNIAVEIVQTESCHPLVDGISDGENIDREGGGAEKSIADAIVDKTVLRKPALIPMIKKIGGHGWIASNKEILDAVDVVKSQTGISISTNSALSVVGAIQYAKKYKADDKVAVCIICGE
jgi:threonine synthase